jgi:hypothetical protein
MSHRSLVVGLSLLAALSGCAVDASSGGPGVEPIGSSDQFIMGGTDDSTDANVVDIVWMMSNGYGECSGSLLAPNMVLTAHHCVSTVQNMPNGIDCSQSSFAAPDVVTNFFVSTAEVIAMTGYHSVREVVVPPDSTNTTFCGVDLALLILSDEIQPSEAVPLVPRVDSQIVAKEEYSAIGFGTTDDINGAGTRRRLDGLHVNCVGTGCDAYADELSVQHEFLGDHGTCEGDSGGPALDEDNRVIGVTSRGKAGCASPVYGDVYSWANWIEQTAQHAAQVGGYPPPRWSTGYPTDPAYSDPVGGACSNATTCPSNICLDDDAGPYCSRVCEDAAPCPDGYTCETIQNLQICQRAPQAMKSDGSGCSVQATDPTKPVPWLLGLGFCALVLPRRRRSR